MAGPNRKGRLTLLQRMLGAFAVTALLFLLTTLHTTDVLQRLSRSAAEQNGRAQANRMAYQLDSEILSTMLLLNGYRADSSEGVRHLILQSRANTEALLRDLRSHAPLPTVMRELDSFEELLPARNLIADSIMAAVDGGANATELRELMERRSALDVQARQELRRILAAENQAIRHAADADERLRQNARWQITLLWLANLALLLLVGYWLAQHLKARIGELVAMTRRISQGDYSARAPIRGRDELDVVAQHFNDMAVQLAAVDKVKAEFVALASHQLRTPVTGVKANIGMLLDGYCGPLTEEQEDFLRDAYKSNERQLAIVDDLLAVARLEAGQMTLKRASVDLVELLKGVVQEHKPLIQQREQTVALHYPDHAVVAYADAQRLQMVFDNLVSNASKYSPADGHVTINVRREGAHAVVSVSDNGIGIDPADMHRLYKKFSRIDNPLSRSVTGTGLGLYLAHEIVRLHGGEITAQSEPGKGTTFTVELPTEVVDEANPDYRGRSLAAEGLPRVVDQGEV